MSSGVKLTVALPDGFSSGFSPGDFAAPDLSQSPQLAVEQWESARDASGHVAVAWGCISGDTSSWSPDATELAENKLAEIASGTAARLRGEPTPMHVTRTSGNGNGSVDGRDRTLESDGEFSGAKDGARTFLAFTRAPDRAHGCFVACTSSAAPPCAATLASANLSGAMVDPPGPGIALRSLALVVHHPHVALGALALTVAACSALAIATRPGIKSRRKRTRFSKR